MSEYTYQCHLLKFADDAKFFDHIKIISDQENLQNSITALFTWTKDNDLNFNLQNFIHLSFKRNLYTTYSTSNSIIPLVDSY